MAIVGEAGAVFADDLFRGRDEERKGETEALDRNEGEVGRVADGAALAGLVVERELDGRPEQLAQLAQTEPDAGKLAAVGYVGVT